MYISVKEFTKVESEFTVEFEIVDCPSGNCRLKIQSIDAGHVTTDIGIYEGDQQRIVKTHKRFDEEGTKYRFLFEKKFDEDQQTFHYQNAQLKIYSIEVTNVENGGTKQCETCATHSGGNCVKCVAGYYISKEQQCVKCPRNTYLEASNDNPLGVKSCKPCPQGSMSSPGSVKCYSNCMVTLGTGKDMKEFNLTALQGTHFVQGPTLFTTKGYKFFHGFYISLCGDEKLESHCINNATSSNVETLDAAICRSTFIPDADKLISTQPISVGENLVNINTIESKENATKREEGIQIHFSSERITAVCQSGTFGVIRLVCDPHDKGQGEITLGDNNKCHSSTCDGCNYIFSWKSRHACAKCTESDYEVINTACLKGKKNTRYLWKENRACVGGIIKPDDVTLECSIFEKSILDFKLVIMSFLLGAVLLAAIVIVLCYRNRSLSYKYSRLIDSSQMRDGELPPSEKCAMEEDEDDEEEIVMSRSKGKTKFLDRLKGNKNKNNFSEFETINLDSAKAFSGEDDDDEL